MSRIDQLTNRKAEIAADIAVIDGNADYQILLRGEAKKKERESLTSKLVVVEHEIRLIDAGELQKQIANCDPKIDHALRWVRDEKVRTSATLSTRGVIERNMFGSAKGLLDTNEPRIAKRLAALDAASKKLESLKLKPDADAGVEISRIQAAVPMLDTTTERIECEPAFAAAIRE